MPLDDVITDNDVIERDRMFALVPDVQSIRAAPGDGDATRAAPAIENGRPWRVSLELAGNRRSRSVSWAGNYGAPMTIAHVY